nr:MAG TPA: hypothetical protein [Caudoviricetes sp.]
MILKELREKGFLVFRMKPYTNIIEIVQQMLYVSSI